MGDFRLKALPILTVNALVWFQSHYFLKCPIQLLFISYWFYDLEEGLILRWSSVGKVRIGWGTVILKREIDTDEYL